LDSVLNVYSLCETDTIKTEILSFKNEGKTIQYLDSVFQKNLNKDYSFILSYEIGKFLKANNKIQLSLYYFHKALQVSRKLNENEIVLKLTLDISKDYARIGKFDSSKHLLKEGMTLAKKLSDSLMIGLFSHNLGKVHQLQGDLEASLVATQKALTVFKELNDVERTNHSLNQVGITYCLLGQNEKSIGIFKESANNALAYGDSLGYNAAMTNLAIVVKRMKKYAY
jgi:tetratricopeptide (TPR) repeat protein